MAGSVHLPGSEGHSAFGMGLGQESLFHGNLLRQTRAALHSRAGSLCALPWPLGGKTSGAGLLANRARFRVEGSRRSAAALFDGWETANMHFATPQAIAKVKHDLGDRLRGGEVHIGR